MNVEFYYARVFQLFQIKISLLRLSELMTNACRPATPVASWVSGSGVRGNAQPRWCDEPPTSSQGFSLLVSNADGSNLALSWLSSSKPGPELSEGFNRTFVHDTLLRVPRIQPHYDGH